MGVVRSCYFSMPQWFLHPDIVNRDANRAVAVLQDVQCILTIEARYIRAALYIAASIIQKEAITIAAKIDYSCADTSSSGGGRGGQQRRVVYD